MPSSPVLGVVPARRRSDDGEGNSHRFWSHRGILPISMSTPDLYLQTLFWLDERGRILGTREPDASPGPLFSLIRGRSGCTWAVRSDVPQDVAMELDSLAGEEPPVSDFRDGPVHAEQYLLLVEGAVYSGPAFTFPEEIARPDGTIFIKDVRLLEHHFSGWRSASSPIVALIKDGHAVSVCFCARRSDVAAEAGVETAVEFRGRGLALRVTDAWALAVRDSGRVPLYSTSWDNEASLGVARKLGLMAYASSWSIT